MQTNSETQRGFLRCGYLPPLTLEDRPGGGKHYRGVPASKVWKDAETCAGYVCTLPEVAELGRAYIQWEKGSLVDYMDGERPSRAVLDGMAQLAGGVQEADADRIAKAKRDADQKGRA